MSQGRQTRDGAAVRRVQVMLDDATIERAKALGKGNLSIGLRKLAKEAEMKVVSRGEEFCSVSHGLHEGEPTYSDAQLRAEVGIAD